MFSQSFERPTHIVKDNNSYLKLLKNLEIISTKGKYLGVETFKKQVDEINAFDLSDVANKLNFILIDDYILTKEDLMNMKSLKIKYPNITKILNNEELFIKLFRSKKTIRKLFIYVFYNKEFDVGFIYSMIDEGYGSINLFNLISITDLNESVYQILK